MLACPSQACPPVPNNSRSLEFLQVIVGDQSHVYQYEAGGMSVLGGIAYNVIANTRDGLLPLDAVEQAIRCDSCCFLVGNAGICLGQKRGLACMICSSQDLHASRLPGKQARTNMHRCLQAT